MTLLEVAFEAPTPLPGPERLAGRRVRARVLREHDGLRTLLGSLVSLCNQAQRGEHDMRSRLRELAVELYRCFSAHLAFEDERLLPLVKSAGSWGRERARELAREHAEQRLLLDYLDAAARGPEPSAGAARSGACELRRAAARRHGGRGIELAAPRDVRRRARGGSPVLNAYERLSAQDTSFLQIEGPTTPMHVGAVALFTRETSPGRAPFGVDELRAHVAARLSELPRYRSRPAFTRLATSDLGRRSRVRSRIPRSLCRGPCTGRRGQAEGARRRALRRAARPRATALEDVVRRRAAGRALRAGGEGPPLARRRGVARRAHGSALLMRSHAGDPAELRAEGSPAAEPSPPGRRRADYRVTRYGELSARRPHAARSRAGAAPDHAHGQRRGRRWETDAAYRADALNEPSARAAASSGLVRPPGREGRRKAVDGTVNDVALATAAVAPRRSCARAASRSAASTSGVDPVDVRSAGSDAAAANEVSASSLSLPVSERNPRRASSASGTRPRA